METREIVEKDEKQRIARLVLEALPEWFEVAAERENYIKESTDLPLFAAFDSDCPIGFLCLRETGKDTAEIHVMGVLGEHHREGVGKALFETAKDAAQRAGYSFLQVKTVQMGTWKEYDETNNHAMGFKEFEVFPQLWDEANPCQVYVMSLA